jgi:hypothetical protein
VYRERIDAIEKVIGNPEIEFITIRDLRKVIATAFWLRVSES